ncbi:MAG: hypothetical protein ACTSX6_07585 [Candidatus Heimdallarchaeaceae archaeon]
MKIKLRKRKLDLELQRKKSKKGIKCALCDRIVHEYIASENIKTCIVCSKRIELESLDKLLTIYDEMLKELKVIQELGKERNIQVKAWLDEQKIKWATKEYNKYEKQLQISFLELLNLLL